MRQRNLPSRILQNVGKSSLQYARGASAKTSSMVTQFFTAATVFYTDQFHFFVADEVEENTNRVRTSANAGDDGRWQLAFHFQNLPPAFFSGNLVEVAHHRRIRMRSQHAAEQIVRGRHIGDSIAHRFIDRVFQRAGS